MPVFFYTAPRGRLFPQGSPVSRPGAITNPSVYGTPSTGGVLQVLTISPDPGVLLNANSTLFNATGSYSDLTSRDDTENATWTFSGEAIITLNDTPGNKGRTQQTTWGQVNGGSVWVTASIGAVSDTAVARVVPNDSATLNNIKMPMSTAQWQALGLSPWGGMWGCQEGSGSDLVASGTDPFTLVTNNNAAAGRCFWQQPQASWARVGLNASGTGNNTGWLAPAGTGPSVQTTSQAWLGYMLFGGNIGAARFTFGVSSVTAPAQMFGLNNQVTGVPRLAVSGNFTGATSVHTDGRVHPVLLVLDLTNSRTKMYTDLDKVTGSFPATALYDGPKGFGTPTGTPTPTGTMFWMAYCTGALAESLSDNTKASLFLKTLGWTVAW